MAIGRVPGGRTIEGATMSTAGQSTSGRDGAAQERGSRTLQPGVESRDLVSEFASNEIVFAVVGHVGSGTSTTTPSWGLSSRSMSPEWARKFDAWSSADFTATSPNALPRAQVYARPWPVLAVLIGGSQAES